MSLAFFALLSLAAEPSPLESALSYVTALEGTKYGWWTGGKLSTGPPFYADNAPPPEIAQVRNTSMLCAAIPNLMLRVVGGRMPCLSFTDPDCGRCCGGTGAYGRTFEHIGTPFSLEEDYPRGTLLGRKYRGVHEQGHVAVLLGVGADAPLLQSYSDCPTEPCPIVTPGVNANLTLREAHDKLPFCKFEYAVRPEDWLKAALE